jgi:hypothetical protein
VYIEAMSDESEEYLVGKGQAASGQPQPVPTVFEEPLRQQARHHPPLGIVQANTEFPEETRRVHPLHHSQPEEEKFSHRLPFREVHQVLFGEHSHVENL